MRNLLPIALIALLALALGGPQTASADCGGCNHAQSGPDIVDTAIAAGSFNTLVQAVQAAGLVDTLKGEGPFTVFAPTDEAFAKVPAETLNALLQDKEMLTQVLTYHVLAGSVPASKVTGLNWAETVQGQSARIQVQDGVVTVDGAKLIATDIETSNGIIHVIDTVILPRKDIVDTAVAAGSFETLVTAVKAADLVDTLKGEGPFTVFAPADSAFAKLPAGTVAGLLENVPQLQAILTYHVVPGRILASDIVQGDTSVKTVNGQTVAIHKARDGSVRVNGARVVSADIIAGNG
ncbi:MAG: fasciclin domain-containing protein, partial [Planctomycetota bacterium]